MGGDTRGTNRMDTKMERGSFTMMMGGSMMESGRTIVCMGLGNCTTMTRASWPIKGSSLQTSSMVRGRFTMTKWSNWIWSLITLISRR